MLDKNQINDLVKIMEKYKDKPVIISSCFSKSHKFYKIHTMENMDILADEEALCIIDSNENVIEIPFGGIEGTYSDVIGVSDDSDDSEIHIIFVCFEEKYRFKNLV